MADISITWEKITRGLPRARRYADDRATTLEEIKKDVRISRQTDKTTCLHYGLFWNKGRGMGLFALERY
jgi:hypothetical protein